MMTPTEEQLFAIAIVMKVKPNNNNFKTILKTHLHKKNYVSTGC